MKTRVGTTTNPGAHQPITRTPTGLPQALAPRPWCTRTVPGSSRQPGGLKLGQQRCRRRRRRPQPWSARRHCGALHAPCIAWYGSRDWGLVCARPKVEHLPHGKHSQTAGSTTQSALARCNSPTSCPPMRGRPRGPLLLPLALSKARSEMAACRRPGHGGGCHRTVQVLPGKDGKLASKRWNTLNQGGLCVFGVEVESCWIACGLLASCFYSGCEVTMNTCPRGRVTQQLLASLVVEGAAMDSRSLPVRLSCLLMRATGKSSCQGVRNQRWDVAELTAQHRRLALRPLPEMPECCAK